MTEELFSTGCAQGRESYPDVDYYRKIKDHPCYSAEARHRYGRMHLPVAPECNIKCHYCVRRFDCVNESRPGITSRVLSPGEALARTKDVLARFPNIRTVAIAGPGEPLTNPETFQTFRLVRDSFPDVRLCMSTNGLLLPDKLPLLAELDVATITVTLNAVDPNIGKEIYAHVRYAGQSYHGLEAAQLLLSQQLLGIKMAVAAGIVVKVNSVMCPTINDDHLVEVARKAAELGVYVQNIMPLIPQAGFAHLRYPTPDERKEKQDACVAFIPQMRHCRQCRADAIGLLGKDVPDVSIA
ncbi:MAG: nitrogenase cofactor biosynthesis protein NifB [Chloroflexi bacterium]|nr:nitrogenase cofactor biosynthesis protein NifB [Chloroflexota bacterium]